jgi:rhamnogalacturonyl hydrolase YesR
MINFLLPITILSAATGLATAARFNPFWFNSGFDIVKVVSLAQYIPSHSWEYGVSAQAQLELYDPQLTVFSTRPFPVPYVPPGVVRALNYAGSKMTIGAGTGINSLINGAGSAGDPASLGVYAVMLGKSNASFAAAAESTVTALFDDTPRFGNGAISHRADTAELWADFMYMVPPFLAYYAADTGDANMLRETVRQIGLYRDILRFTSNDTYDGLWMHIIGPQNQDTGLWASGNGWAAAGMTRVLATVMKAPTVVSADWRRQAVDTLTGYIKEILDAAVQAPLDNGLVRNYVNNLNGTQGGFGEISGSTLLASVVYRMAVLRPAIFNNQTYLDWADDIRETIGTSDSMGKPHVTDTGVVTPAVNPLWWKDTTPFVWGSPEGQAFVVLMYTAYRDCIASWICVVQIV